ncbi:MAG TPA: hypothetical protein VEG29_03065 [Candidatus Binatia bacterium]|nr:hypothetical protein [Candidatus Binatia bacterium]
MARFHAPARSRALVLTATLAAFAATGCAGASAGDGSAPHGVARHRDATGSAIGAVLVDPATQDVVADLQAAFRSHDHRAAADFRRQLRDRLGSATVRDADGAYRRILTAAMAADGAHDARDRAGYRAALASLCASDAVVAAIEPCAIDLASIGG